jgi:hypothetical protein
VIGATLNSSLFFLWFMAIGNGRNLTGTDVEEFPLGKLDESVVIGLRKVFQELMTDYRLNSIIKVRGGATIQEFRPSKSKSLIDEIDRILARHFFLTLAELDFIINYDIKYRMGDALAGDEDGE